MAAMDDENARIARSRNGDHAVFESLIEEHQHMIHSLCYRMTGSMADAEDLAQETFIQAYRHLSNFRAEARFSSWLYRIAMNQCLNWRKRRSRENQLHKDWIEQAQTEAAGESSAAQPIQNALLKLHPKQRAAILLTVYDGLSHAEAAKILGCSETTISWRLFAARAKLKRWLKDLKPASKAT
jgi:RNA polymerase sigma-70 factor (ECF subfamily)